MSVPASAHRELDRARDELRVLACITPIGRWGLALANRAGLTIDHFRQDDARVIFSALVAADECGWIANKLRTFLLVRAALRQAGLWDERDTRTHAGGMRWAAGSLAGLFCRVSPAEAEDLVPVLASDLIASAKRIRGAA